MSSYIITAAFSSRECRPTKSSSAERPESASLTDEQTIRRQMLIDMDTVLSPIALTHVRIQTKQRLSKRIFKPTRDRLFAEGRESADGRGVECG